MYSQLLLRGGGVTELPVTAAPGSLAGMTLLGVDGAPVTLQIAAAGGWAAALWPYTLTAGVDVRLSRADTSDAVSVVRLQLPSGSEGLLATTLDAQGYITITNISGDADVQGYVTLNSATSSMDSGGYVTAERSTP